MIFFLTQCLQHPSHMEGNEVRERKDVVRCSSMQSSPPSRLILSHICIFLVLFRREYSINFLTYFFAGNILLHHISRPCHGRPCRAPLYALPVLPRKWCKLERQGIKKIWFFLRENNIGSQLYALPVLPRKRCITLLHRLKLQCQGIQKIWFW